MIFCLHDCVSSHIITLCKKQYLKVHYVSFVALEVNKQNRMANANILESWVAGCCQYTDIIYIHHYIYLTNYLIK